MQSAGHPLSETYVRRRVSWRVTLSGLAAIPDSVYGDPIETLTVNTSLPASSVTRTAQAVIFQNEPSPPSSSLAVNNASSRASLRPFRSMPASSRSS